MKVDVLGGLRGEPRSCKLCGTTYLPPPVLGPSPVKVRCKACKGRGRGCPRCVPKDPPLRPGGGLPSGEGSGWVHAAECPCWKCNPENDVPVDVTRQKTCGNPACVDAWRLMLASGSAPPPPPDPEETRQGLLNDLGVPKEFRAPLEFAKMFGGKGCEVIPRARHREAIVRLGDDIVAEMVEAEHPFAYFWGPLQLGKSRYAVDVMARGVAAGVFSTGLWTSTRRLSAQVAAHQLGTPLAIEERACAVRILVLDDLFNVGTGARAREGLEAGARILSQRWDECQPTIVTSSWPPSPTRDDPEGPALSTTPGWEWLYERLQQGIQVEFRPMRESS